ncbi:MAG: type IX secretion system membrane protein PorP/SprF [Bacteroidetes bacterium]|nr:type IX secretion system membrane protein PorP/SprF [Bacteroidota bacterium]
MKSKKIITLFLVCFCLYNKVYTQNQIHLTQYMMHQPFINTASIGSYENMNGALLYKTQWVGLDGAPKIGAFSINSPLGDKKNYLGLTVINDKIGVRQDMDISGNYAYRMPMSAKSNLTLGLSASLRLLQGEFATISTEIENDPLFQSNSSTIPTVNFKFGSYYNSERFYIGFAIPNLIKNTITTNDKTSTEFDFNDMQFYLHSGYSFPINNAFDLKSSVLFKQVSGAPFQMDINSQVEFKHKFGLGLSYRSSKELASIISFELNSRIKLAYSFDYAFNELNTVSSGTHEIMILFNFINIPAKKAIITAPRF